MKTQSLLLIAALAGGSIAVSAQADTLRSHQRHNVSKEITRSNSAGRSMTRTTEQVASQNQFRRQTTATNGQGNTAQRSVEGSYDADAKRYTRSMNGTRFNGDTYSSVRDTQKTDDGYVRSQSRTNVSGNTANKQVAVVVDKDNHSITKQFDATGFNSKTYSATIEKSIGAGSTDVDGSE
jgi:hypothetical protein